MQNREGWRRGMETRLTLLEATILMVSARLMLALIPFPRLMHLLSRPTHQAEARGDERLSKRKAVRRAIFAVRQRLHKNTCLHRAIAAQLMLRRRGVSTTLYFGAARLPDKGLTTHAWVQDGDEGIVGFQTAQKDCYYVVATFPEGENPTTFIQPHVQSHVQQQGEKDGTTEFDSN